MNEQYIDTIMADIRVFCFFFRNVLVEIESLIVHAQLHDTWGKND